MVALYSGVNCDIYNVVMPTYLPPTGCDRCADWSGHDDKSIWGVEGIPDGIGNSCAMPSLVNGDGKLFNKESVESSYSGPWCYCNGTYLMHRFVSIRVFHCVFSQVFFVPI